MLLQPEIPRHCNHCIECQALLSPGSIYYSALLKTERFDYCNVCWHDDTKEIQSKSYTCYWKGVLPVRRGSISMPQTKGLRALEYLKTLLQNPIPDNCNQALLLALYLVRKRILVFRKDFTDPLGDQYSLFEVNETEEMLPVRKVSLLNLDLAALQGAIAEKLKG